MTIKVSGTQFDDIVPELQKALDTSLARTLSLQQGKLARQTPKDTGRMASSWFISQNTPNRSSRPDNWAPEGAQRLEIEKYPENRVKFDGTWFISNNVPYALYTALAYQPKAPKAPKDWFTAIANQTGVVFSQQFNKVKPK